MSIEFISGLSMWEIIRLALLLGMGFYIGKILVELVILLIALLFAGLIGLAALIANWWLERN